MDVTGMLKSTMAHVHSSKNFEKNGHYAQDNSQHLKNEGMKKTIHTEKSLNQLFCIVTQ
jgi:hypothetical protein